MPLRPPTSRSTYRRRSLRSAACRRSRCHRKRYGTFSYSTSALSQVGPQARTASSPPRRAGCGWRSGLIRPSSRRDRRTCRCRDRPSATSSSSLFFEIRTTFGLDDGRRCPPCRGPLDDRFRNLVAEVLAQRTENRAAVLQHRRYVLEVLGRESAAHVDHGQADATLRAVANTVEAIDSAPVPRLHLALLRKSRHGTRCRPAPAQALGEVEHFDRHFSRIAGRNCATAAFAPARHRDAAEHLGAWCCARNLLDLGGAVDREQRMPSAEGARDVALLLDGVAIGMRSGVAPAPAPFRSRPLAVSKHEPSEASSDSNSGAGLAFTRRTRGCPAAPWKRSGSCRARLRGRPRGTARVLALAAAVAQEFLNAIGHSTLQTAQRRAVPTAQQRPVEKCVRIRALGQVTRWRRDKACGSNRICAAVDWRGDPSAHLAMKDKPLRYRASWWKAAETKKARSVVALSRVPPLSAGCAGSPPAADHGCKEVRGLFDASLRETLGFSFPWRLSGLLSGYLPTDTRPQARAKLGQNGK